MNFFQKLQVIWQNVSFIQRFVLVSIFATVIIVGFLLVQWAGRPDFSVLYSELDPGEASKITEKISDKGIAYKLTAGGTTVWAPKEHISQLHIDLAKEGLPEGGQKGFKLFDDQSIGISPFVQNVNFKRALQDELAKSIQMIDGVRHARILIVSPEQTLFRSQNSKTSASVMLRLNPGYRLSSLNIAAITHLVASSVEGLKSENVTVTDSKGTLLTSKSDQAGGGAGTVADYRERIEFNLARKAEDMLTMALGPGRAIVKVSAEIDMTSINTITETPLKGMAKKEESTTSKKTTAPAYTEGDAGPGPGEDNATEKVEYQLGKTIETKVVLPGEIISLSVAVFVDLSPAIPADANEAVIAAAKAAKPVMDEAQVEAIIKNALGLKEIDSIEVVQASFNRPAGVVSEEELAGGLDFVALAGQASLGVAAVCMLLIFKMFSGAKKKSAGQLAAGAGTAGLADEGKPSESLVLRNQIADALKADPDKVRQLFGSWMKE
ncbi:flagellar basal-body MS-ring/collar protein FliF [Planctomycetota bacterium]